MAFNQRATQEKRRRERSKQESRAQKAEDRVTRKELKKQRDANRVPGEDPDLEGIVAGPQPGQIID
jgi:hypothetical protein